MSQTNAKKPASVTGASESAQAGEDSRSVKFGEFLQVVVAQILKKKEKQVGWGDRIVKRPLPKSAVLSPRQRGLTMNLEPLIEFFITTLSQPDRFICEWGVRVRDLSKQTCV